MKSFELEILYFDEFLKENCMISLFSSFYVNLNIRMLSIYNEYSYPTMTEKSGFWLIIPNMICGISSNFIVQPKQTKNLWW